MLFISLASLRVVRRCWLRRQQFERDTEPFRGFFAILEYRDLDRRTFSQQGKQPGVMNECGIGSENG